MLLLCLKGCFGCLAFAFQTFGLFAFLRNRFVLGFARILIPRRLQDPILQAPFDPLGLGLHLLQRRALIGGIALGKPALFAAVVHYIIQHIRPPADVPLLAGASLPDILRRLAGLILKAALSPQAIALHRLVTGESSRFPELAGAVENDGGQAEATALIAGLLSRELPSIKLNIEDQAFAAQQFIYMLVAVPQRRATGFGVPMTAAELEVWTQRVVTLFLEGYKGQRK